MGNKDNNVNNNELWQAFFTEVSEQLDNLELILADIHAETSADIHQLFRDFHTIKSSCAMMDFHSMEKIAHASEDYLDLVRKGRASLTRNTINPLLSGIDWLKSQLQQAKNTGKPPGENPELVQTLRALSVASAPADSPKATETTQTQDSAIEAPAEMLLSQDEIDEFASACRQELLIGLNPATEPPQIKRALNKLVSICNLVGFIAISSLLKKFIKLAVAGDEARCKAVASEIIDRIIAIEKIYQVDCGTHALRNVFLDAMFADFAQLSGRLDYLLDLIEQNPDDTTTIVSCEDLLHMLGINAGLFGYHQLLNFFRYVLQTIRSIRRGDIPDRRAAFNCIRQALDFPIAEQLQDGETDLARAELQLRMADLNFGISQAIYSAGHDNARDTISTSVDIDIKTLDQLMPGSLKALQDVVHAGKVLCEIDIDMDCDPQLMDNLISWISATGDIIHNRSIFSDGQNTTTEFSTYICFIAAFELSVLAVDSALHDIDMSHQAFRCRAIQYLSESDDSSTANPHAASNTPGKDNNLQHKATHEQAANTSLNAAPASTTLRIDSHTLDSLVTQVGEMIMVRNMMAHVIYDKKLESSIARGRSLLDAGKHQAMSESDIAEWKQLINSLGSAHQQVMESNARMGQSVTAIQNRILDLRVIPVSSVFNRIPQLVRKMAETQNKKIALSIDGKDVRIDKGMVDVLMEPLIHLVRNCIDHGIEPPAERIVAGKPAEATLSLSAFQEGSTLILEIADDGRGINLDRIRESAVRKGFIKPTDILSEQETCKLIFLPGFSTADVITETSGRGVGMDVVITRINHIGGDIDVKSTPGNGTCFSMRLPLSAAIQGVILASVDNQCYAIPQSSVIEVLSVTNESLRSVYGQSVFLLRDTAVPLFRLNDLVLQQGSAYAGGTGLHFAPLQIDKQCIVIIMGHGSRRIGIVIDSLQGREDVFVRELHKDLRTIPAICGAAARGNGDLVFILNSNFLLEYAEKGAAAWLVQHQASA